MSYAQFGGGIGTAIDPYRIYSKVHLEELNDSLLSGNNFTGIHFNLMNDILDSLRIPIGKHDYPFNGNFHGKGHNIALAIDLRDSTQYSYMDYCLFPKLYTNSSVDSISISGYIFASLGIVGDNYGNINYCINNLSSVFTHNEIITEIFETYGTIYSAGISCWNSGGIIRNCINNSELYGTLIGGIFVYCGMLEYQDAHIVNCINNGDIIVENTVLTESPPTCGGIGCNVSGFEINNMLIIENCINCGKVLFTGNQPISEVGGILGSASMAHIINCQNNGNISGKISNLGGIVGVMFEGEIFNCSNYGNLYGETSVSGICPFGEYTMKNCFNSGMLLSGSSCGGIVCDLNSDQNTIMFNLNIANINESAIIANANDIIINPLIISNNYYDKQMCLSRGIAGVDVPNSAEGKLTTQLIGISPALQAMLGDGWSYAEGRYPIPLGLENDSMALVAATPVYLHFETEEDYNHVDSVSRNFTVGLENNVSWDEANGRVSFSSENVTLLNIGLETLTVNLGDHSKKVRINILDTETSNIQETITEKGITIFPNPSSNYININLNGLSADKMEICDITGKAISSQIIAKEHNQIHIGNIKPGMYLLKIYNKNQNVTTLRFVKN